MLTHRVADAHVATRYQHRSYLKQMLFCPETTAPRFNRGRLSTGTPTWDHGESLVEKLTKAECDLLAKEELFEDIIRNVTRNAGRPPAGVYHSDSEQLNNRFRRLKQRTCVPIKQPAAALRFRDDTGEAHPDHPAVARQLADRVQPRHLGAAAILGPDRQGLAALREFSQNGWSVGAPAVEPANTSLGAGLQSEDAGDVFTDQPHWDLALDHLETASQWLSRRCIRAGDSGFHAFVRSGTRLSSIYDFQGRHDALAPILHGLVRAIHECRDGIQPARTAKAVGLAYKGAAVSCRHRGRTPVRELIHLSRQHFSVLSDLPVPDRYGMASALRDQARPWLIAGLGFGGASDASSTTCSHATIVPQPAISLLEGTGRPEYRFELAITWADLAMVHACPGEHSLARRAWERSVLLTPEALASENAPTTPLTSKQRFTEQFLAAAAQRRDEVLNRHQRFRSAVDPSYQERLARAHAVARAAEMRDVRQACGTMFR